jgi:hypothetical protein
MITLEDGECQAKNLTRYALRNKSNFVAPDAIFRLEINPDENHAIPNRELSKHSLGRVQ